MTFAPGLLIDSEEVADRWRRELDMDRTEARLLGEDAVAFIRAGRYQRWDGTTVDWSRDVAAAVQARVSLPPGSDLPEPSATRLRVTDVTVANESTLSAARRLVQAGARVVALNMANGVLPGGGFLTGSRAQEETLCRSSALYATLAGDAMYDAHEQRDDHESSDWVILSPNVPVFRTDDGATLEQTWSCDFLTCAAPYAPRVGQPRSGDLLARRMARVLEVARAFGYDTLVLGAWGCGAYGNDSGRTAEDVWQLLTGPYDGCFAEIVFAITDWSPERRFLGPFRDRFCPAPSA